MAIVIDSKIKIKIIDKIKRKGNVVDTLKYVTSSKYNVINAYILVLQATTKNKDER